MDADFKNFMERQGSFEMGFDLGGEKTDMDTQIKHGEELVNDILRHHGVKGMKWGVRRAAKSTASGVKTVGKTVGTAYANAFKKIGKAGVDTAKTGVNTAKAVGRGATKVKDSIKTRVKEEVNSKKRTREWAKIGRQASTMDNKTLNEKFQRALLENDMNRLTKKQKVRSISDFKDKRNDKKQFRNRATLTDTEIKTHVERLRLKDNLRRQVSQINSVRRENGIKMVNKLATAKPELKPFVGVGKLIVNTATGSYD